MITIVGGTYLEVCIDPHWYELYGSGLRGAIAISSQVKNVNYVSCIGKDRLKSVEIICSTFGIQYSLTPIERTISFNYYHPLSKPTVNNVRVNKQENFQKIDSECILMYGQFEATYEVHGKYVIYDPQNGQSFSSTNSSAEHLALVLNKNEAVNISGLSENSNLIDIGRSLLIKENAEVIVIKNGPKGALVITNEECTEVPVYKTSTIFPIGSGDIFSAIFSLEWAIKKNNPSRSAFIASRSTAYYCENIILPIPEKIGRYKAIKSRQRKRNIYIAAPFFSIAERWIVAETRKYLKEFDNNVFSPFHDVGLGNNTEIVEKDLNAIRSCDVLFAILNGFDPGTIFEIGYAIAIKKKVIIFVENPNDTDLTMFRGAGCRIIHDFSSAIYIASWS